MNIHSAKIITGLDIGSSKVSGVVATIAKDGGFSIIGQATQDSRGVSRGSVVSLSEAVGSVSAVLKKLKGRSPLGLGQIYVNISGETLKGSKSRGMIPLTVRGREITKADMARCVDAASTIRLPFDREIVHRIVQRFSVDDQPWIKDPLGLYASRIACEVYIITAASNSIQNILKCVNNAGCDVKEVVYTGIADSAIMLDREEKKEGVLLLGIGAALTEISIFFEGALCDIEIIQTGVEDFKNDFKTSDAFNDLLSKVTANIVAFRDAGNQLNSVVLTGGIVFADGVIEYLEEKLSCPVRMGIAKEVRAEISGPDSIRLCTAIGLARYAAEKYGSSPKGVRNLAERASSTVIDIFNNYF